MFKPRVRATLIGVVLAWLLTIPVVVALYIHTASTPPTLPVVTRTLVTAAHLGDIAGYDRVYVDAETDYAIYVMQGYPYYALIAGDTVTLVGTTATVSSVFPAEFTLDVDNIAKIVPGVSGEPVYCKGTPIGFISGWNGNGHLRCIFY